jgi:hypothetical protein
MVGKQELRNKRQESRNKAQGLNSQRPSLTLVENFKKWLPPYYLIINLLSY